MQSDMQLLKISNSCIYLSLDDLKSGKLENNIEKKISSYNYSKTK